MDKYRMDKYRYEVREEDSQYWVVRAFYNRFSKRVEKEEIMEWFTCEGDAKKGAACREANKKNDKLISW